MTQKELSYLEDAIGHETNIVSICEESIKNLSAESLKTFITNEIEVHQNLKTRLLNLLEEKANER